MVNALQKSSLKCCLIVPCEATREKMFHVGKHMFSVLKIPGTLHYYKLGTCAATGDEENPMSAPLQLLDENGALTEDSFRRFARYRIKKEEVRQAIKCNG